LQERKPEMLQGKSKKKQKKNREPMGVHYINRRDGARKIVGTQSNRNVSGKEGAGKKGEIKTYVVVMPRKVKNLNRRQGEKKAPIPGRGEEGGPRWYARKFRSTKNKKREKAKNIEEKKKETWLKRGRLPLG